MNNVIALIGNPNSGKTTLFNALTGSNQKVGNWTGVTVEKKESSYKKDKHIKIVDLPGLYSLKGRSIDQKTTYNYLTKSKPTAVINVVDGTNLERNLFLTLELLSLNVPMVIAINMCDELEKNNVRLDTKKLSKILNVPIVLISALKGKNLDEVVNLSLNLKNQPKVEDNTKKIELDAKSGYDYICEILSKVLIKKTLRSELLTQKADKILMHKILGLPIFFLVMTSIYFLSMKVGGFIGQYIALFFEGLGNTVRVKLIQLNVSTWVISLSCDAVINSIGGILSFLPQILILFALIAIIEESGYSSRIAFLLDRFFRSFGLSGKSFLPMIVSCGCTVTGLLSTRIIEGVNERRMTVFLSPFIPCGAKTAVFAYFSARIFNGNALIASSMYFLGIICVVVFGSILKRFKAFSKNADSFILEIPSLRTPSVKDVFFVMIEKVKEFITRAGLIVFTVSVFLWLLKSVGTTGYVGDRVEDSFLFFIGDKLKYLFYPLGFFDWHLAVSILSGTFAKEAVVESLSLLSNDVNSLFYNQFTAYAFMAFILLSPPCVASLATAKSELGSKKWFLFMLIFQTTVAYIVAFIINLTGVILESASGLILSIIIVIIISLSLIFAIKRLNKSKCKLCAYNCKGDIKCRQKGKPYTT